MYWANCSVGKNKGGDTYMTKRMYWDKRGRCTMFSFRCVASEPTVFTFLRLIHNTSCALHMRAPCGVHSSLRRAIAGRHRSGVARAAASSCSAACTRSGVCVCAKVYNIYRERVKAPRVGSSAPSEYSSKCFCLRDQITPKPGPQVLATLQQWTCRATDDDDRVSVWSSYQAATTSSSNPHPPPSPSPLTAHRSPLTFHPHPHPNPNPYPNPSPNPNPTPTPTRTPHHHAPARRPGVGG